MLPPLANTLFDPDTTSCPAVARHLDFVDYAAEVPVHTQRAIDYCPLWSGHLSRRK